MRGITIDNIAVQGKYNNNNYKMRGITINNIAVQEKHIQQQL